MNYHFTMIGKQYKRRSSAWRAIYRLQERQPENKTHYGVFKVCEGCYEVDAFRKVTTQEKNQ